MKASDRQAKRNKFARSGPGAQPAAPRWRLPVLLGVIALILAGAGAALALQRPQGVGEPEAAGRADGAPTEILAAAPAAATLDHAPYPQALAEDGYIRLDAAQFADGHARHYTYMHGEQPIEFFVLQSSDGVIRAAFNACDVCYLARRGYLQEGDNMICQNCGRVFSSQRINVEQGGCNPAPLRRSMGDGTVVIAVDDIIEGARFF